MKKLQQLIKNESNRREAKAKNTDVFEMHQAIHKGGHGKTILMTPDMDMSLEGQLGRLGLELIDGKRRLTAILNLNREAHILCDGKSLRLTLSELGILSCEEATNPNPTLTSAMARRV